ncbi:MAG TPA: polyprenyl diphosphate synthase [Steroidobacteraceae bacterium]|jgi:undecaprenyl diphosphate synthase|nr:polyprenyl diphosphate synthase [Steroidobacteraceae bacterium]
MTSSLHVKADPAVPLPQHVAIVMDGNGRWALGQGRARSDGHHSGLNPVRTVIEECARCGIGALTLFAFSSENWSRPAPEVANLMSLFCDALDRELPMLHENGVRLRFVGELSALEARLRERITAATAATAINTRLRLQIAISYGGRQDILSAARVVAAKCERGELTAAALTEANFASGLALAGLPDPDLFIRTGGEQRVSNFLLWNLAYAELYFTDTLWPDFTAADFALALQHFTRRQRRFGLTGHQVAG